MVTHPLHIITIITNSTKKRPPEDGLGIFFYDFLVTPVNGNIASSLLYQGAFLFHSFWL